MRTDRILGWGALYALRSLRPSYWGKIHARRGHLESRRFFTRRGILMRRLRRFVVVARLSVAHRRHTVLVGRPSYPVRRHGSRPDATQHVRADQRHRGAKPYTTWATTAAARIRRSTRRSPDQQGERVAARGGVDVPGHRHGHLQPADRRQRDVRAGLQQHVGGARRRPPARSCGASRWRARSAPAA